VFHRPRAVRLRRGRKGTRSAGQRPELCLFVTVSTKPDAPRDRFAPASRQVALFRPYRDPDPSVSGKPRRSKRTGLQPDTPLSLRPRRRRAGLAAKPGPRTVRVSPSDLHRSTAPRRHVRSLANAPFPRDEVEPLCAGPGRGSFRGVKKRQAVDFVGFGLANAGDGGRWMPVRAPFFEALSAPSPSSRASGAGPIVQLSREREGLRRPCGGQMGPAHKARDDGGVGALGGRPRPGSAPASHRTARLSRG
jgi:hypothetical protein